MTTQNLALFKGLGAKMAYLNQRQRVISQNIANSDTPGYRPKDLLPVDFSSVLKSLDKGSGVQAVKVGSTNGKHLPAPDQVLDPKSKKQRETYEVAPAGNAVIMEEQLVNAQQTAMDYNLMANIYQKQVGMIKTALGR